MVEIVVEDGDERRVEGKSLFERAGALHLESDFGDAVGEDNVGAVGFFGLRGPLVADGRAIRFQRERAGNFAGDTFGGLDVGGAFGTPACAGWGNFEIFVADDLAAELDGELAFVLREDAGAIFLPGESQGGAGENCKSCGGK